MNKFRVQATWPPYDQYFKSAIKAYLFVKHFDPTDDEVEITDLSSDTQLKIDDLRARSDAEEARYHQPAD